MGLDAFGRMVRDIRLVRALLLYDMAKDLDISPAELSAIECGRKNVPDWFVSKLQETYGISDMHAQSLIKYMKRRGLLRPHSLPSSEEHGCRGGAVP